MKLKQLFTTALALAVLPLSAGAQRGVTPGSSRGGCPASKAGSLVSIPPNATILSQLAPARVGGIWRLEIDPSGHAPHAAVLMAHTGRAALPTAGGVLLVDPSSPLVVRVYEPHDGASPVAYALRIPNDASLHGMEAHVQGLVFGAPHCPHWTLSNGLMVVVGC